jgi:outer membrane murein-binding lipoprotein Lpp
MEAKNSVDIRLFFEVAAFTATIISGSVWIGSLQGKLNTLNIESIASEKEKAIKEIKGIIANQRIINESEVVPVFSQVEIENLSKKIDKIMASSSEMSDRIEFFESKLDTVKSTAEAHYKKETKANNDINKLAKEINILKSELNTMKVVKKETITPLSREKIKPNPVYKSAMKTHTTEEITTELKGCKRSLDKVVCSFLVTANKKNRGIRVYSQSSYLVDNLGHKYSADKIVAGGGFSSDSIVNNFIKGIPVLHTIYFSEISSEASKISGLSIHYNNDDFYAIFKEISF